MICKKTGLFGLETPPAAASIRRIVDGFKAFHVLLAGYDSGLFDWLERNGPANKQNIATALNLRGQHLGGFLQSLEDIGLLTSRDGLYRLVDDMRSVLLADSPWYKASELEELLSPFCGWADLSSFLSQGWVPSTQPKSYPPTQHPFFDEARRLAACLKNRRDDCNPRTLLCFDGSNGLLAAMLCQGWPEVRATVVVPLDALPCTQHTLEACGVIDRCRVLPGTPADPSTDDQFDYAVVFHSLYPFHVRKSLDSVLASFASRLAPGGELCTAHWFCLQACETAPGGLRDLDKAVLTDCHPLCGIEKFGQRLEGAGLTGVERGELAGEYGNTKLHFAQRLNEC
ncbi:MAG: hypothetical protein FWG81_03470 [Betaproteobacteria bacterium]|nr:hypothetical protein [Betaproteobacteria bacterium]